MIGIKDDLYIIWQVPLQKLASETIRMHINCLGSLLPQPISSNPLLGCLILLNDYYIFLMAPEQWSVSASTIV